jgi:hypothetical protein
MRSVLLFSCIATLVACAQPDATDKDESDLAAVGDVAGSTNWGAATTCKTLPTGLPTLKSPAIVVSLDGMTLHLWDQAGTFDKVYPIGPGAIENGKSLTPIGHFTTGPADTTAGAVDNGKVVGSSPWSWWYRCKMWWTDPDTKAITPVYGGLPLIRLNGPPTLGYAIHGPIDDFGDPAGGSLRRAYVSHGCVRMRAPDIGEVYVLIHGHGSVPVTIQRAVERDSSQNAIDIPQKWVGSECASSADCNFAGGVCHANPYGHAFCTLACSGTCADMTGEIATACVPDGVSGMCVRQASTLNNFCRPYEAFEYKKQTPRFGSTKPVDACVPGSAGFVGDPCLSSSDCPSGRTCSSGICTQSCDAKHVCPSLDGIASACVAGRCLRTCSIEEDCGAATPESCSGPPLACVPN